MLPVLSAVAAAGLVPVMPSSCLRSAASEAGIAFLEWEKFTPADIDETVEAQLLRLSTDFADALARPDAGSAFESTCGNVLAGVGRSFGANLVNIFANEVAAVETLNSLAGQTCLSLIVFGCDNTADERAILLFARELGIPSLQLAHGIYHSFLGDRVAADMLRLFSDHMTIFGERAKRILVDHGNEPERIHLTGAPGWDRLYIDGCRPGVAEARQALGLDPAKPVVAYCASYAEGCSAFFAPFARRLLTLHRLVLGAIRATGLDIQLVVRPHPNELRRRSTSTDLANHVDDGYTEWLREKGFNHVHVVRDRKIEVLRAADVVLQVGASSVMCEAMLLERPVIILPWFQNEMRICDESDGVLFTDGESDLATKIVRVLQDETFRNELLQRQEKAMPEFNFGHDGKASQRVADLIVRLAGGAVQSANVARQQRNPKSVPAEDLSPAGPLRILEVVHDFPPQSESGTELHTLAFSQALRELGHEVAVVYPVSDAAQPPLSFLPDSYGGIRVYKFNITDPSYAERSDYDNQAYVPVFEHFLSRHHFDIVHFQHLYGLSVSWVRAAQVRGIPVFLKMDDMFWFCPQLHLVEHGQRHCSGPESLDKCYACRVDKSQSAKPDAVGAIYCYLAIRRERLRHIFRHFDFIHTPSQFLKNACRQFGLENDECHVIRTGIRPFAVQRRKRYFKRRKFIRIGFLGEIHERKGITHLLEAIALHQQNVQAIQPAVTLKFGIYGRHFGDETYAGMLKAMAVLNNVRYHGQFSPEDRTSIFSSIDLMVAPSLGENYPFVLREALYAGLPVAATRIAGVPEIVEHGRNGFLFEPGDVTALARIFDEIALTPNILASLEPAATKIRLVKEEAVELEQHFLRYVRPKSEAAAVTVIDGLFRRGRQLIEKGDTRSGLEVLSQVLVREPRHPETLMLMGDIYHHLGREGDAENLWRLASRVGEPAPDSNLPD